MVKPYAVVIILNDKAIHMVSAYSCQTNLVIGPQKVEDKSNEITAIPKLLDTIDIRVVL